MATTSNIDDVVRWQENWVNSIDFTGPGKGQSLGRDVANVVIVGRHGTQGGILRRCADRKGPDGQSWPDNAPAYKEYKPRKHG
jgi:hypothetical protein